MLDLIGASPLRFVLALLIGLATAWWIWARREPGAGSVADATPRDLSASPAPTPAAVAEPVAAPVAAPEPAPAPAPAPVALSSETGPNIAAAVGADDDLRLIKGIGPKLADLCNSLGVRRFDQIAAWGTAEIAEVDQHLGNFRGRIDRDEWVAQARLLAAGDLAGWEARWGGGTNS